MKNLWILEISKEYSFIIIDEVYGSTDFRYTHKLKYNKKTVKLDLNPFFEYQGRMFFAYNIISFAFKRYLMV